MTETNNDYLNLLPQCEALEVTDCCLELRVKHRCGTAHVYVVTFEVDNEHGLESQLSEDLSVMLDLMHERVQEGQLEVNGRKYAVTETTQLCGPEVSSLFERLPIVVLPPKLKIRKIKDDKTFFKEDPVADVDTDEAVEKILEENEVEPESFQVDSKSTAEPVIEPVKKKRNKRVAINEQSVEGCTDASK